MSNSDNTVDILKKVPLFYGLTNRQLKKLAGSCVSRNFSAGEEMVKQGENGLGIFIIVSGQAEAIRELPNGDKVSVNTFGPTDFFGELALLNEGARTASVFASSNVESLVLARWHFIPQLEEDAEMAITIAQELAKRFRNTLDILL